MKKETNIMFVAHAPITPKFPYGANYEIVDNYVEK
jgi:hypothetical protein